jgi:hypothetical protein
VIKFENTEVMNFKGALRGMRNPLNSWDKSDSFISHSDHDPRAFNGFYFAIGPKDLKLAQRLIKAGSDHRKFMRQIFVCVDIVAPSFWWPEFDTYKVATVRNSCSKMHRIHVKSFTKSDFSYEGTDALINKGDPRLSAKVRGHVENTLEILEFFRVRFNETKDKDYWRALIENLPHGYNMRATITFNYETLYNIYGSRHNHKVDEWSIGFMKWIDSLPYADELIKFS